PTLLANISDPPTVLFYRGNFAEAELPLAIVGARRSTRYGMDTARGFAKELAEAGACIVSGLAAGVDAAAAEGALEAKENPLPTIAVLGGGVDMIYPAENANLYERIAERGAILSEFAPGLWPQKGFFPMRNRIISGLSLGVLVTEAGERSGASITVGTALDQGRDTFAVPGRITDRMSKGTNRMIRDGQAAPVLEAADILRWYGIESAEKTEKRNALKLSPLETKIMEALRHQEESFDELCEKLSVSAAELNSALTSLEFSEIIKQLPGRVYELAPNIS
ncbi:MAG: DNA-processing protein DprA, partial [Clostridia bacterium]|nr:DNA-processing protein DprA [Clostridia bacterium]